VKWKNIALETHTFFITASIAGKRPLFNSAEARDILFADCDFYRRKYAARIFAYVLMPEHYHVTVDLNAPEDLHGWLRDVQGHSAKELARWIRESGAQTSPSSLTATQTIWKEQARALGILTDRILRIKIDYIHNNPVKRNLVTEPGEWPWSSWRNYYLDDDSVFRVDRLEMP